MFYLMDEDYDTYDFGPFESLEEAKETMDELLDDVDSPYLREDWNVKNINLFCSLKMILYL